VTVLRKEACNSYASSLPCSILRWEVCAPRFARHNGFGRRIWWAAASQQSCARVRMQSWRMAPLQHSACSHSGMACSQEEWVYTRVGPFVILTRPVQLHELLRSAFVGADAPSCIPTRWQARCNCTAPAHARAFGSLPRNRAGFNTTRDGRALQPDDKGQQCLWLNRCE